MTATPATRPRSVDIAFWVWVVGAIMLIVGGLIAAMARIPDIYRGAGIVFIVAGAGMAFLAGRCRRGEPRFRQAAVALSLAIVVVVGLIAVFGVLHILALLSLLPLIAGAVLITRPAAAAWFDAHEREKTDG